jgi:hypothetical protein
MTVAIETFSTWARERRAQYIDQQMATLRENAEREYTTAHELVRAAGAPRREWLARERTNSDQLHGEPLPKAWPLRGWTHAQMFNHRSRAAVIVAHVALNRVSERPEQANDQAHWIAQNARWADTFGCRLVVNRWPCWHDVERTCLVELWSDEAVSLYERVDVATTAMVLALQWPAIRALITRSAQLNDDHGF